MRARRDIGGVLVPEFRRLVAELPGSFDAARAEDALLGARRFLVPPDARDDAGMLAGFEQHAQSGALAGGGARHRRQRRVPRVFRRADAPLPVDPPLPGVAVAEGVTPGYFLPGLPPSYREPAPAPQH